jgi:hypothetical protein
LGDEADEATAEQNPQHPPEGAPHQTEQNRFGHNQPKKLLASDPQTAQNAEHRPPLNNAKGDGVVDEEHAHDEGEQTEGG